MKKKKIFTFILCVTLTLVSACGKWNGRGESVGKEVDFDALQIEEYTYPKEFTLGQNLESAITELALMFDTFDTSQTKEQFYPETFLTYYCQNSRMSFDYLEKIQEENDGLLSKEQVEYIQYSLTNEFIDFKDSIPEEGLDSYEDSSGFWFGKIIFYEAEPEGEKVKLTAEFERGMDGWENMRRCELDIVLIKNPKSCFDGYSIEALTSKDITTAEASDGFDCCMKQFWKG